MTTATITHEGETLHVPIKNISLPAGHRLLAPGEVPDGLFTQEELDEKIEDRLKRERKKYEGHVELEEGAVVVSAEEAAKLRERSLLTEEGEAHVETFDETKAKAEKADALEHKETLREVAEVEGIKGFDAFSELAGDDTFDIRETDEGEKYAVTTIEEDGEEKTVRVAEHPKYGRKGPFAPAVYSEGSTNGDSSNGASESEDDQKRSFPRQRSTQEGKTPGSDEDPVGAFINKANQRRSGQRSSNEEE